MGIRYSVSGLLLPVEFRRGSVCPSVRPLVTSVYCGKAAEAIEMPFEVIGRMDPRNGVLHGVQISHGKGKILDKMGRHGITCEEKVSSAVQKWPNRCSYHLAR